MEANDVDLKELLLKPYIYYIPIYQRTYKWTKKECANLVKDLVQFSEKTSENLSKKYFMGTITCTHKKEKDENGFYPHQIIDGQQRLTTFTILYLALYLHIKERENKKTFKMKSKPIYEGLIHTSDDFGSLHKKIVHQMRDRADYESLFQSNPRNSRMKSNLKYFLNYLQDKEGNADKLLDALNRVNLIFIQLREGNENPQKIFETINSSGVKLTTSEQFKNLLLMSIHASKQEHVYKTYWEPMEKELGTKIDEFMFYYTTIHEGMITQKDLYRSFRSHVNESKLSRIEMIQQIHAYHKYYQMVKNATHRDSDIDKKLKFIKEFDYGVMTPMIMYLLYMLDQGRFEKKDALDSLHLMESFIVRRFLSGLHLEGLNDMLARVFKQEVFLSMEKKKERFTPFLSEFFRSKESNTGRFPKNGEVRNGLLNPLYANLRKKSALRAILLSLSNLETDISVLDRNLSIEHIMPQTLTLEWKEELGDEFERIHKQYLHTLCNMTLTAYNPRLSNHLFSIKKDISGGYDSSSLSLNRTLSQKQKWNEQEMLSYGEALIEKVITHWPYPSGRNIEKEEV